MTIVAAVAVDDWVIGLLVGYESAAWMTHRVRWVPSMPLITTILDGQGRPVRWAFVAGVLATLVVHFELHAVA